MTTDIFCFYFKYRLIQTDQTGGQLYSDTSPFSVPWLDRPSWLCLGNTPVEHSAHNAHIKDSNPAKGGIVDNHGCALGPKL
jgi:hypothetical protein